MLSEVSRITAVKPGSPSRKAAPGAWSTGRASRRANAITARQRRSSRSSRRSRNRREERRWAIRRKRTAGKFTVASRRRWSRWIATGTATARAKSRFSGERKPNSIQPPRRAR
jgi:hypothetical protein